MNRIKMISQTTEKKILRRNSTVDGTTEESKAGFFNKNDYRFRRMLFQNIPAENVDGISKKMDGHERFASDFNLGDTNGSFQPLFNNQTPPKIALGPSNRVNFFNFEHQNIEIPQQINSIDPKRDFLNNFRNTIG